VEVRGLNPCEWCNLVLFVSEKSGICQFSVGCWLKLEA
jgi:hypothetical protein